MSAALVVQSAADRMAALRQGLDLPLPDRLMGLVGLAAMVGIAFLLSAERRRINWRLVLAGVGLQLLVGVIVLKTGAGRAGIDAAGEGFNRLIGFTREGSRLVFGDLVDQPAYFAFSVLPSIIFFSSLMSVLYHLGIMQLVVRGFAWVMQRTLRTSGAETLSASGNIFLGLVEAPLLVKPYVSGFTASELFAVLVGGFATAAGGVMAAYIAMLSGVLPNIAGHLLAGSVMNAPAGLYLAKILQPEVAEPATRGVQRVELRKVDANVIEAAASGAIQGGQLAFNVGALLIAFIALVALVNALLGWGGGLLGLPHLSLQGLLGQLLRPVAWLLGVPWQDTAYVGGMIGLKTVLNDFVAYAAFAKDLGGNLVLAPRSALILTYALIGFANLGSIAIAIGGIGGMAPERRGEIARFGLRAMIGGTLAALTSAAIAGMLA